MPVVVRFPAGPRVRLKTVDPPKGKGLEQKKRKSVRRNAMSKGGVKIVHLIRLTSTYS